MKSVEEVVECSGENCPGNLHPTFGSRHPPGEFPKRKKTGIA